MRQLGPMLMVCFAPLNGAWALDTAHTADTFAMGSVGVAHPRTNASVGLNPGLLAISRRYDIEAAYGGGPTGVRQWSVSAVDSRSSLRWAGGFSYGFDRSEPDATIDDLPGWVIGGGEPSNVRRRHDLAFSGGVNAFQRRLSVGVTGNLNVYNHDLQGEGSQWDIHAGVGARPLEPWWLGVSVRNMLSGRRAIDRPLEVVGGSYVEPVDRLSLAADFGWTEASGPQSPDFFFAGAGAEWALDAGALRTGWRWTGDSDVHFATAGFGLGSREGMLSYGVSVPVAGLQGALGLADTVHMVSIHIQAPSGTELAEEDWNPWALDATAPRHR